MTGHEDAKHPKLIQAEWLLWRQWSNCNTDVARTCASIISAQKSLHPRVRIWFALSKIRREFFGSGACTRRMAPIKNARSQFKKGGDLFGTKGQSNQKKFLLC